jgi:hypothetical protein
VHDIFFFPSSLTAAAVFFLLIGSAPKSPRPMSKEEKRALAIAKLAKVFGKNKSKGGSDSEGEDDVLAAILDAKTLEEAHGIARKRLDRYDSGKRYSELLRQGKTESVGVVDAVLRSLRKETHESLATTDAYWDKSFDHGLTVHTPLVFLPPQPMQVNPKEPYKGTLRLSDAETDAINKHLARTGFFSSRVMEWGGDVSMPQIIEAMAELKRKGWPSAFVFAYKQPWLVIERLFDFAASVMGTEDLAIEPSVFAWLLDPPSGNVEQAGNNGFHLPHRDFSFTETFDDGGAIKALSVWVPLSDVDARNGCMFVLPKEFDATHDKPQHPNHLSPLFYFIHFLSIFFEPP